MTVSIEAYMSPSTLAFWKRLEQEKADIFVNHLPVHGYQDNSTVRAICQPFGEIVYQSQLVAKSFFYNSAPSVTASPWLDTAGVAHGFFSYGFWERGWDNSTKQALLRMCPRIWQRLGTEQIFREVAAIFGIGDTRLWLGGPAFRLDNGSGVGSRLDVDTLPILSTATGFVLLPISVARGSETWVLVRELVEHFTPITVDIIPSYDQFYCDYTAAGEPVLS